MSKKWNLFSRKRANKADSHGTTAADEELQFQPMPPNVTEQITKLSAVQNQLQIHDASGDSSALKHAGLPMQKGTVVRTKPDERKFKPSGGIPVDNGTTVDNKNKGDSRLGAKISNLSIESNERKVVSKEEGEKRNNGMTAADHATSSFHKLIPGNYYKSMHGQQKPKLIKPGNPNMQQHIKAQQTAQPGKDVKISDEYSDPYDAVQQELLAKQKNDGYIEPYQAQQICHDFTHGCNDSSCGCEGSGADNTSGKFSDQDHYQDPWDKCPERTVTDYEDPWDQNKDATLLYNLKRHGSGYSEGSDNSLQQNRINLDGSGASSTSSASPNFARRRLVRVENQRVSPNNSPYFDKRLILPKDSSSLDNYSEPWGKQVKFKAIDKRLVKAEPSLEELRLMSSGKSSSTGTASPMSSGRASPVYGTEAASKQTSHHFSGLPQHLINMNKSKSRSLDMRNEQHMMCGAMTSRQQIPNRFSKSASDDQLVGLLGHRHGSSQVPNRNLCGVGEYEEPWDKSQISHTLTNQSSRNPVSHSRSRSYELQGHSLLQIAHPKSYSYDKSDISNGSGGFYEQPWDKMNPADHMQSMQRFQQRKLELHPSEAMSTRDFDPMVPLDSQIWYHGAITRDEAEMRLRNTYEGSYLVRQSESTKNNYSLSVQTNHGCIHMLLRRTRDGSWILGEFSAPFLSAPEMVRHYTRNKLNVNDTEYVLLSNPIANPSL